jgi:hypothetical protein
MRKMDCPNPSLHLERHMSEYGISVSRLQLSDPDQLIGAIRGSQLDAWVLGGHRAQSELSRIMLPGSCFDHAEIGSAMWFRGGTPKDCYTLMYVDACPQDGHSFTFNSRHRDQCAAFSISCGKIRRTPWRTAIPEFPGDTNGSTTCAISSGKTPTAPSAWMSCVRSAG